MLTLYGMDYDGTYTRDPKMSDAFITMAELRGHCVLLTTSRTANNPVPREVADKVMRVIYCGPTHKRVVCKRLGIFIDVWIDDQPETVNGPGWLWLQRLRGAIKSLLSKT